MRASMSRRLALRRPTAASVERLEEELAALRAKSEPGVADQLRVAELYAEIERLKRMQRAIPFIDPIDVRYNRFAPTIVPRAKAVMFCLMDVSASMGEREKDLAKRFFILLHLFLKRKYERVDIVFIRHTHEAAEVDEQEFFYGRETGGTAVSSALKTMIAVRDKRYPSADWNVYCAQASDGDNSASDTRRLRGAAARSDPAANPILRLYRDRRGRRRPAVRRRRRQGSVARLRRAQGGSPQFRAGARRRARRHLSGPARALRQASQRGGGAMTLAQLAPNAAPARGGLLFDGAEWDFATVQRVYAAIERIGCDELGLDVFPNQIEIISAEQMLDAYSSVGMPLMYAHWSYGKRFVRDEALYRKGYQALAYEIVINSNPCISYCMEENTMAMQTLVIAHAAFGHNHFFKNNYLFQQWTDPAGILDYLDFAKRYVASCEERHGVEAVETTLDAAHALMGQGVFRYRRAAKLKLADYERRRRERLERETRTIATSGAPCPAARRRPKATISEEEARERKRRLRLPEENLLYFLEKNSPTLRNWQRELLRIVRNLAQYFYPQRQTKLMNEGCATFVHYTIVNRLYDKGLISEGALMEILHSHANVVAQFDFDDPRYGGINPYALGFAMMQDIQRICVSPTEEDREWFPDIAGPAGVAGGHARRMGQLSRRILRAAVPLAASHAQASACSRSPTRPPNSSVIESRRSTTQRATAACARRSPTAMTSARASRTFRSSTSTSSATASLCCGMRRAKASGSPKPDARRRCATSGVCGVTRCGSRTRRPRRALEPRRRLSERSAGRVRPRRRPRPLHRAS